MSAKGPDPLLDRLLSGRSSLAVTEKEAMLEQVLASVEAEEARSRRGWLRVPSWAWVAASVAAAVPLMLLVPRSAPDEFTARGVTSGPSFALACAGGGEGRCRQGEKLAFQLSGAAGYASFAAFARGADGTILWYFPGGERPLSVSLANLSSTGLLEEAAVIGPEHAPGSYEIYGVFLKRASTKDEVRRVVESPERAQDVVRRSLVVEGP